MLNIAKQFFSCRTGQLPKKKMDCAQFRNNKIPKQRKENPESFEKI